MPGARASEDQRRSQILEATARVALFHGLEGATTRAVAKEAKLSPGLVLFHFVSKDGLLDALLDHLLEERGMPPVVPTSRGSAALEVLVRDEVFRLTADPRFVELFFEYWVRGARVPSIRRRIRAQLRRYRAAFEAVAGDVREAPVLAALAVSLVHGALVQVVADPSGIDVDRLVRRMSGALRAPASRTRAART